MNHAAGATAWNRLKKGFQQIHAGSGAARLAKRDANTS
jgi:hypothetical protein